MQIKNVLVTGCGGDIGIAIGRILRDLDIVEKLYGCDISCEHPGNIFFDECLPMVRADSPKYFSCLMEIITGKKIDLVIPAAEPELRGLMENNFYGRSELFLSANIEAMRIGFDKYATVEMLKDFGCPHLWTVEADKNKPLAYPCIWKSKTGCGSKQIKILNSYNDLLEVSEGIYQEYVPEDEGEYTCGLYRSSRGDIRTIIFKRKLRGGLTGSGEVVENKNITGLLFKIAKAVDLRGSINVQLRLKDGIPYVFEINPRFSSTVMFRHKLGFKDLFWSIQDKLDKDIDSYQGARRGIRFYKVYEDVIDWRSGEKADKSNYVRGGGTLML